MITFIVTTYNLEDWLLRRCLTSIVEQGITDYEIIVVDDESAISPRSMVDEFAQQAPITLYTQLHSRQGAARNLALNLAKGNWIQFVDGDDYLYPHTVKQCLEMAETNKLDLLMFGYREVSEKCATHPEENIKGDSHCPLSIMTGNDYMLQHNLFGSCCTLLFRRALLDFPEYGTPLRFTEHIYIEDAIQAQILELINRLKVERNLSVIFITHDLGVVANMADDIAVMYAGKIVEHGSAEDIFYDPRHPYTWALLSSMPDLDTKEKLDAIPGTPPNMIYPPVGDAFADRNKYAMQIDFEQQPPMFEVSETHRAATWLLHPDAPKVEMPKIITDRIARMKAKNGGAQ